MIPVWLAIALMGWPCNSTAATVDRETTVHQCPVPQVQGPHTPPGWVAAKVVKPKAVKKPVKKKRKRKKHGR